MPDSPRVPGETASPDEVIAGLRTANARLRELLAERDGHIAHLLAQVAQVDELQALVAELRAQVADLTARVGQNEELQQAAILGRAGQARTEVAAGEDRPEAGPAQGAAGRDHGTDRAS